jgi:hypothetical protein
MSRKINRILRRWSRATFAAILLTSGTSLKATSDDVTLMDLVGDTDRTAVKSLTAKQSVSKEYNVQRLLDVNPIKIATRSIGTLVTYWKTDRPGQIGCAAGVLPTPPPPKPPAPKPPPFSYILTSYSCGSSAAREGAARRFEIGGSPATATSPAIHPKVFAVDLKPVEQNEARRKASIVAWSASCQTCTLSPNC